MKPAAGSSHADQRGAGAVHQAVAQEAVLAGNKDLFGVLFLNLAGDVLKRHDAVEGRHLDPDHLREREQLRENRRRVQNASRGLVEIEQDERRVQRRQPLVIPHDLFVLVRIAAEQRGRMEKKRVGSKLDGLLRGAQRGVHVCLRI